MMLTHKLLKTGEVKEHRKMSEEKPITKSFLEQKIHKKAVEHWKSDVQRVFESFANPLFDKLQLNDDLKEKLGYGKGNPSATLQRALSYGYSDQETFLRYLCSNYDETKKRTIKEYEQRNTDMILNSLSSLGDYLYDHRRY